MSTRWSVCTACPATSAAQPGERMPGWSGVERALDLRRHRGGVVGRAGRGPLASSPPADQHRRETRPAGGGASGASPLSSGRLHQLLLRRGRSTGAAPGLRSAPGSGSAAGVRSGAAKTACTGAPCSRPARGFCAGSAETAHAVVICAGPAEGETSTGFRAASRPGSASEGRSAGSDQTGTGRAGSEQAGSDQTGTRGAGSDQAGSDQTGTRGAGSDQTGTTRAGCPRTCGPRTGSRRTGSRGTCSRGTGSRRADSRAGRADRRPCWSAGAAARSAVPVPLRVRTEPAGPTWCG
jgi:hypothetical protein